MRYIDVFERAVRVHGGRTAIVTDDGRSFTYDEFDRRSTRLATVLEARIGDEPVAVLANNGVPAVEAMVAGHKRGTPTVQLPFRGSVAELRQMVDVADATAVLFDDANAAAGVRLVEGDGVTVGIHARNDDRPTDVTATESDAGADVEDYEAILSDTPDASPASLPRSGNTNVFFTSGTTTTPKAVAFDGEAMWLGAYQGVMEHGIDHTDVAVVTTPWYHMVTADAWLYPHWMAGATTVLHSSFHPEEALELIDQHEATGLLAVPTQLNSLASAAADSVADTGSLSYVRTGGAVVTKELVDRTTERLSGEVFNTYGLTEGGPNLTFAHPAYQEDHPGTVGRESFAWEVRVVELAPLDEHPDPEATVDPGERGEIVARGPGVPDGYLAYPEAEARTFFDEWLRTRDVARIDDEGFLYVIDRIDNMFTSGGENIYPAEVTRAIEEHDAVTESLVFGLPDDHWGNRVAAVVVADEDVGADDLDDFLTATDHVPDYKRPREYALRSEPLPRTDTGTVERERAREAHFE